LKKLKHNRTLSFIVIAFVYIISTIIGISVYRSLEYSLWLSLLIADIFATISIFIFSLIFTNASVYDPYWSVQPPVILIAFIVKSKINLFGVLLIFVVLFWAIRLTLNWAYTFKNLTCQDWRYTMLKEKTGVFYPLINFIGIHLIPTVIVYFCILPAVYAITWGFQLNYLSLIALTISLSAVVLQGIADVELHKFRKHSNGTFIRTGVWKYSRHPNYLAEILMWWGVGLSVIIANPDMCGLIFGAIANTILFLTVSIPMAEKKQSKKQGYLEYKKQTRMLLPIKKGI
jgi:steroid 5-alpha reductase family enzyme